MPDLTLSHLSKRFGTILAVDDLNLRVSAGQRLVILGPSGCGKSTTLRLIAGLEKADRGSIYLGDTDLSVLPPARRGIGMIFQDAALYPHLSVRENLAFALGDQRLATAEIAGRIKQTAEAFQISDLLDRHPQILSGGQRSRVAVARGIIKRPAVLLLDEPLTGLDPPLRWQLQNELLDWHGRHPTTTVHVTHDQQEAMLMGDTVAVMRDGIVQQVAAPMELYRQPANRFVAGFVGLPGMNFASGHVCAGTLSVGATRVTVPQSLSHLEGAVDLGARPEAITLVADTAAAGIGRDSLLIEAVIESLRPTGAQWLVGVVWSANLWWVTCPSAEQFEAGQRVGMLIDFKNLYGFPVQRQSAANGQPGFA